MDYYYNISYIPQQIEFILDAVSKSKKHVETSRDIFVQLPETVILKIDLI